MLRQQPVLQFVYRYMDIVTYKTAYYSFYLPVACGLHLAGGASDAALATAQRILVKMGQYFQIQDDYLDCFADAEVLGKVGTDIQDNKCSWLVCTALRDASAAQRGVIFEHYGKDDAESIGKVKAVYKCALAYAAFVMHESDCSDASRLRCRVRVALGRVCAPLVRKV
jgi:farnesyl diphosphate synthase